MLQTQTNRNGFTIVELLITIVVIAILAGVSMVAYRGVQQRARDSVRQQDVAAIAKATHMYSVVVGNFAEAGCGSGSGSGWLHSDYDGTGPNVPINDCLTGKGPYSSKNFLGTVLKDPSGLESCTGLKCTAYMKSSCAAGTWIMAHLEGKAQLSTDTDATCNPTWDTQYGINYIVKVE